MSQRTEKNTAEIQAMPEFVGTVTLAGIFGVSDSYIPKMAERGIIPKADRGKYPFVECLRSYIDYVKGGTTEGDDGSNYQAEKTRLTSAQADKAEFELAIARKEYISIKEVKDAWCKILRELNARMMNLPTKIGPLAVGIKTPQAGFDLVMKYVRELLQELSETEVVVTPDGPTS